MPYIVTEPINGYNRIVSFWATAVEAATAATENAAHTALANEITGAAWNNNCEPGWWLEAGTLYPDRPDRSLLREAAVAQRTRIQGFRDELNAAGQHYRDDLVHAAHRLLAMLDLGSRAVFLSGTLTDAAKLGWVQASAAGFSDLPASDPHKFFAITASWTTSQIASRIPAVRILVCSTVAPHTSFSLAAAASSTAALTGLAADPSSEDAWKAVGSGEWIDSI